MTDLSITRRTFVGGMAALAIVPAVPGGTGIDAPADALAPVIAAINGISEAYLNQLLHRGGAMDLLKAVQAHRALGLPASDTAFHLRMAVGFAQEEYIRRCPGAALAPPSVA